MLAGWLITAKKPRINEDHTTFEEPEQMKEQTDIPVEIEGLLQAISECSKVVPEHHDLGHVADHHELEIEAATTPSGGRVEKVMENEKAEKVACRIKKGCYCETHQCTTKKVTVSSKNCRDIGGGKALVR